MRETDIGNPRRRVAEDHDRRAVVVVDEAPQVAARGGLGSTGGGDWGWSLPAGGHDRPLCNYVLSGVGVALGDVMAVWTQDIHHIKDIL